MITRFRPSDLDALLRAHAVALAAHEDEINALNVFPVADGDTGTNMRLTVQGIVDALDSSGSGAGDSATAGSETLATIRRAVLLSARGSSGIILSQWLRSFCSVLGDAEDRSGGAGADDLRRALAVAADAAYGAVAAPVEGTILTVARAAADAVADTTRPGSSEESAAATGTNGQDPDSVSAVWSVAAGAAEDALARTPELLEVLARAGVVDSGGAGLTLLFQAAAGRVDAGSGARLPSVPVTRAVTADEETDRYEVTFLLDAADAGNLVDRWAGLGDAIVVAGGENGDPWRCHVHTADIDAAVEAGRAVGRVHALRVEPLPPEEATAVGTAVVAVTVGDGIAGRFLELGAHVVARERTMNPSTGEVLDAIEATGAAGVVVLPNDDDAVHACDAAVELAGRPAAVLPTRTPAEGLGAVSRHDGRLALDDDVAAMRTSMHPAWWAVALVVRDAETPVGPVIIGQWVGLAADGIEAMGDEAVEVAVAMYDLRHGRALDLYVGAQAEPGATDRLVRRLRERRPHLDIRIRDGGQPYEAWLATEALVTEAPATEALMTEAPAAVDQS